jgi:hypothetical protein
MTVKELKTKLSQFEEDTEIVINTGSGDYFNIEEVEEEMLNEDLEEGYDDEDEDQDLTCYVSIKGDM